MSFLQFSLSLICSNSWPSFPAFQIVVQISLIPTVEPIWSSLHGTVTLGFERSEIDSENLCCIAGVLGISMRFPTLEFRV